MAGVALSESEYKFGAGRYWHTAGAISLLGDEVKRLGKRAYVVGGETALSLTAGQIEDSLHRAGVAYEIERYSGPPSLKQIAALCSKVEELSCDVIVGVGGGRALDLSKAIAARMELPVITVPTSAATCAAYAPLSLLYKEDGAYDRCVWHGAEVNAVLVDTDIMATQPPRLLAAGILDAMAKCIEIANGNPEPQLEDTPVAQHSAFALSQYTYHVLESHGRQAVKDLAAHHHTKLLDDVIFINIALTGVISGIAQGKGQTALGHGLYDAVRTHFVKEGSAYLHGEIVAVGLLAQLVYNGQPERVPTIRSYMEQLNAPRSLAEIGVPPTAEHLELLFQTISKKRFILQDEAHYARLRAGLSCIGGGGV